MLLTISTPLTGQSGLGLQLLFVTAASGSGITSLGAVRTLDLGT